MAGPLLIQRLEVGEFWVPMCVEYPLVGSLYVPHNLDSYPVSAAVNIPCYIVDVKTRKRMLVLKNSRIWGGMADVLIAARDWLFSANRRSCKK